LGRSRDLLSTFASLLMYNSSECMRQKLELCLGQTERGSLLLRGLLPQDLWFTYSASPIQLLIDFACDGSSIRLRASTFLTSHTSIQLHLVLHLIQFVPNFIDAVLRRATCRGGLLYLGNGAACTELVNELSWVVGEDVDDVALGLHIKSLLVLHL